MKTNSGTTNIKWGLLTTILETKDSRNGQNLIIKTPHPLETPRH